MIQGAVVRMTDDQHLLFKADMIVFCEARVAEATSPGWKTWWAERLAWWEQH